MRRGWAGAGADGAGSEVTSGIVPPVGPFDSVWRDDSFLQNPGDKKALEVQNVLSFPQATPLEV